jgi:PadR family transcriptional regulator, regulatory protein PadR
VGRFIGQRLVCASILADSWWGRRLLKAPIRPPARPLDKLQISAYYWFMRRKPGTLIPLERSVLEAGTGLREQGTEEFHGFLLAKEMQAQGAAPTLTAYGTLYRALDRMANAGLLSRRWEDPLIAAQETRPRRRLYQITAAGQRALAEAGSHPLRGLPELEPGTETV